MPMPKRHGQADSYRYGFQGQEKDDEIKGEGNSINYKFRMHDPRVGRFFAVDPLFKEYPFNSSYAFSENFVIAGTEIEGLESGWVITKQGDINVVNNGPSVQASNAFNSLSDALVARENGFIDGATFYKAMENQRAIQEFVARNPGMAIKRENAVIKAAPTIQDLALSGTRPDLHIALGVAQGYVEAPSVIIPEIALAKLGKQGWKASRLAQKSASQINKVDNVAGLEFLDDAIRTVEVPFQKSAAKISNLTNIDDVAKFGKNLSTKNLDEALGGLKGSGWKQIGGEKGSVTTFEKIEGNKRFYLQWNKAGMTHSADGKPIQYWKLYKDKISSKKVLFRGSKANNYKAGGRGATYIDGN